MWHPNLFEMIKGRTGWLARVVREGTVKAGDVIALANEPAGSIS
jgi:MOSC domain-containing protein YiiM